MSSDAGDLMLRIYRAESYVGLQEYKTALEELNVVISKMPNWPEVSCSELLHFQNLCLSVQLRNPGQLPAVLSRRICKMIKRYCEVVVSSLPVWVRRAGQSGSSLLQTGNLALLGKCRWFCLASHQELMPSDKGLNAVQLPSWEVLQSTSVLPGVAPWWFFLYCALLRKITTYFQTSL